MNSARITRSVVLDATLDAVWQALTDPALLADWLGADVALDVRPGGDGSVVDLDGTVRRAVVEAVEPLQRVAFRWWPADGTGPESTVELELAPAEDGDGTRLVVTETVAAPAGATASASASATGSAGAFAWGVRFVLLGCCLLRVAVAAR